MTLGPEKLRSIHSLSYLLINYFIQKPKLVTFSTVRLKYCSRPSFKAHSDLPQWSADSTVDCPRRDREIPTYLWKHNCPLGNWYWCE